MRSRSRLVVFLAASLALVAGCSDGGQYLDPKPTGNAMSQQQQYAELLKRPSVDEITGRYGEMRQKIQDKLSSDLGIVGWEDKRDSRQSGCSNEFPEIASSDVVRVFMSFVIAPKGIPSEQWAAASAILSEIGGGYGFSQKGIQVDRPPYFEIELKDQYRAQLALSTEKTTVLSVETGCHLTSEAKQRGGPKQSPN